MADTVTDNIPNVIASRMVQGLRAKLELSEDACYLAAAPAWVEGAPHDNIVQVIPGGGGTWGAGEGAQQGGELFREQQYTVAVWFVVKLDPHGVTEQALIDAGQGILDFTEKVRKVLTGADFGIPEQEHSMRYRSESATEIVDGDRGILMRTMSFAVPYATPLIDDTYTLEPGDFSS